MTEGGGGRGRLCRCFKYMLVVADEDRDWLRSFLSKPNSLDALALPLSLSNIFISSSLLIDHDLS